MSELNTNKPSRTIVLEKAINPKLPLIKIIDELAIDLRPKWLEDAAILGVNYDELKSTITEVLAFEIFLDTKSGYEMFSDTDTEQGIFEHRYNIYIEVWSHLLVLRMKMVASRGLRLKLE